MLNKIIMVFLLTLGISIVQAQEIELNPDHPDSYVVVKGDTLWDIAGRFLQEPWRWPEIWNVNPQIENPHLIYPGDVVTLKFEGGSPVLAVDRPGDETGMAGADTGGASQAVADRNVKLSPEIRAYPRGEAIQSIPIDVIRHLLSRPMVMSDDEMDDLPYVVSGHRGHLVSGKQDKVFARGLSSGSEGEDYSIYRKGHAYKNSKGKVLGYEFLHVADSKVLKYGDPSTMLITQSNREVLVGDRLVELSEKDINSDFIPKSPGNNVHGSIISAIDGVSEIGRYQTVVLDQGSDQGLEVGNVLGVYQSGEEIKDKILNEKSTGLNNTRLVKYLGQLKTKNEKVTLPEDLAGVVMVFRTFNRISYALVMEAYGPIKKYDTVKNL